MRGESKVDAEVGCRASSTTPNNQQHPGNLYRRDIAMRTEHGRTPVLNHMVMRALSVAQSSSSSDFLILVAIVEHNLLSLSTTTISPQR